MDKGSSNVEKVENLSSQCVGGLSTNQPASDGVGDRNERESYSYCGASGYEQALQCFTSALALRMACKSTKHHSALADGHSNIGNVYRLLGSEANHSDIANCYADIDKANVDQGECMPVLECLMISLEMRKAIHGAEPNHPAIVDSYSNIGRMYNSLGRHASALEYLTKSLEMKAVYGAKANTLA